MTTLPRPQPGDCAEYYFLYIDQVPGDDVRSVLRTEIDATSALLAELGEARAEHRYAPDKWSVKDVVAHIVDTERLFSYRALSIARQDPAPLPGMDQDLWARSSGAEHRSLAGLDAELRALRASSLALVDSFDAAALDRRGIASEVEFRVGSIPWIIAGHELHHRKVLEERYRG